MKITLTLSSEKGSSKIKGKLFSTKLVRGTLHFYDKDSATLFADLLKDGMSFLRNQQAQDLDDDNIYEIELQDNTKR